MKKRRFGPAPLDPAEKRRHCVSVRLNPGELARLDAERATVSMQRGEYLRAAAFDKLPPTIPEVNRKAYSELSRTTSNLNQIAKHLNQYPQGFLDEYITQKLSESLNECRHLLNTVRAGLIGANIES